MSDERYIVLQDQDCDTASLIGPFLTPLAATEWRTAHKAELERRGFETADIREPWAPEEWLSWHDDVEPAEAGLEAPALTEVTFLGPNLSGAMQRLGSIHVHKAGCRDITVRYEKGQVSYSTKVGSQQEAIESFWSDFIDANDRDPWTNFESDTHFAPRLDDLPHLRPVAAPTAAPVAH